MNADELVAAWALEKYKEKYKYYDNIDYFHKFNHLKDCATTKAIPMRFGWECGCYSEYTRDDGFETAFTISCDCLVEDFFRYSGGDWDLPDIIQQLEEYSYNLECPYWEED